MEQYNVKEFLLDMINKCYNLEYVPEYHYDVMKLEKYYINPERNTFFIAIDTDIDEIVGSAGIRGYDKNYDIPNRTYTMEDTATIYRVFVRSDYRHNKIGSKLVNYIEEFSNNSNYKQIYLHTQKDSYGALPFWLNHNYIITMKTNDEFGTIHMEKKLLTNSNYNNSLEDDSIMKI
ncbi:MAG: GNAT family N-acetyltransferase [Methanosphaera sp.]|nr:GNAT family N-acetyltransferase [Methanosphaera sp.]